MIFDFIVATILIYGFYRGYSKGFVKSLASFFSVFIGVIIALNFSYLAAEFLNNSFSIDPKYLPLFSFVSVFIVVLILINIISNFIDKVIKALSLGVVNKLAGGLVFAFLYGFIISTGMWFVDKAGFIGREIKAESVTYEWLSPVSPTTVAVLGDVIPGLDNVFQSFEDMVGNLKDTKDKFSF